jgi:hypothetical protein
MSDRVEVINRGIAGETLAQMARRFHRDAVALKPDVIAIQSGGMISSRQRSWTTRPVAPSSVNRPKPSYEGPEVNPQFLVSVNSNLSDRVNSLPTSYPVGSCDP